MTPSNPDLDRTLKEFEKWKQDNPEDFAEQIGMGPVYVCRE